MNQNQPTNYREYDFVYFLGVGGIGMSALAKYFLSKNIQVYGYDKTKTTLTSLLEKEGVKIHYQEDVDLVHRLFQNHPKALVCYTPAIPVNHTEYQYFIDNNITMYKRSAVLGMITQNYFTIAIAGTHGKTTTSTMVAHILHQCGIDCIAFLGGISTNFNSNILLNEKAKIAVVEADEFDRSFLTLTPNIALITSIDADHLDIYGDDNLMVESYQSFVNKIKPHGVLITKSSFLNRIVNREDIHLLTYSSTEKADFFSKNTIIKDGTYRIDMVGNNKISNIILGLPGKHNIENAVGAFAIAEQLTINPSKIKMALQSFTGVKRRFEYHIKTDNLVYIDDYAHHPSELKAFISSVKELYPNKKITGIFQPHLYSRTKDFADDFAQSLSLLDELILLEIYPARELPIEGINAQMLADKVNLKNKTVVHKNELINYLHQQKIEVLLTFGAGDIDTLVQPIKQLFQVHE